MYANRFLSTLDDVIIVVQGPNSIFVKERGEQKPLCPLSKPRKVTKTVVEILCHCCLCFISKLHIKRRIIDKIGRIS